MLMTANAYSFCHEISQALSESGALPLLLVVFEERPWRLQKGQRYQYRNITRSSGAAESSGNDLCLRFESDLQALWVGLEGSKNPSGPNANSDSRMWSRCCESRHLRTLGNERLSQRWTDFPEVFLGHRLGPSWAPVSQECWWWSWKICGWERSRAWQLWTRRTAACELNRFTFGADPFKILYWNVMDMTLSLSCYYFLTLLPPDPRFCKEKSLGRAGCS